ncbi:MAG: HAD family hydrolase [Methanosarcina sp.]|jgi:putative hydrolase of the HAD superfamily|nr:HAD family hydrolase [Methanosarcina sp.]MDD3318005.1 HAD family hydrolase [Methanosarcina sp.]MDD4305739.1 HAD family hydrolase [Methanosarcina sp.]MDD4619435.1 HAD family hydrolase [Methanosarcina sp.]NLN43676.1 HAD family hydrolase [Methanosarcina sp.]
MKKIENNRNGIQEDTEQIYPVALKAVLFDMDNTLFDFVAAKLGACREILSFIGRDKGDNAEEPSELFRYFLRGVYGFEDCENIRDYMQERNIFTLQDYRKCCEIYEKEKLQNLILYPAVTDTLDKLKELGLKLVIITDANRHHALSRLTRVRLLNYFDFLVAADMTGTKKPDPAHFLFALEALGTKPEETLVVGDSIKRDMAPARKLGMKTAYASYGDWRPGEETDQCFDFKLNTFSDLLEISGL